MPSSPFVHLHLHTQYSLLDGAIKHNPLFERAKSLNMPAVAMTDHGNMFGAVEFYEKARANDVKPILGCEVYLAAGSRFDKERRERDDSGYDAISHLLLLAMNETGYKNLVYLVSKAYLDGFYYKPRIDLELLRSRSDGLIATSGCLSSLVCRAIVNGENERAWSLVEEFSQMFPDRYYLELQRHGISEQDLVNAELIKMSSDFKLPLLATNDAHYLEHDDHSHHEALLCIGTGSQLSDPKRFRFTGEGFFVKSGDEMRDLFHDHPSAIENALVIADRCDVEIPMGEYHMPEFQVPAGSTKDEVLVEESWRGLRRHLERENDEPFRKSDKPYVERMERELDVIKSMGFSGYFLIVADFISHARKEGIPVGPGRGSSAGSLVAYSLGITGIDPIEYDIIFERFLNPERVSMPDIDVDFCMRRRDEVIQYVADRYDDEGDDGRKVSQIITFGKLQARASIRDVGRVMGAPYGEVDRIAKLIPETLGISLEQALHQSPELRSRSEADPTVGKILDTALRLEGLTRHASTHAAGLVIGTQPLIEMVPLYKDPRSGDIMTQWDMRAVEQIGLIKFDFLGLKTLTVIADTEKRLRASGVEEFSIEKIPLDDEATYDLLCQGDTEGVFQVESSGMTDLVLKLKPRSFKEIIPLVALYRPGPLGSGMVDDYVSRKHGLTKVEYLVPELEELTAETLGVIVYQDQVLQIANRVAGYSLGEADLLRRAMGKKKPEEMAVQKEKFVSGATKRGVTQIAAERLFSLMAEFAGYGFPKAHSTAYALITYQTAYLKSNHPKEYLASLFSIESGNHDKMSSYITHAREKGISVLGPDVNQSDQDFTVVEKGIRFGLAGIKNVGEGSVEAIVEARSEGGSFTDIYDFCRRVDARRVNRRVVESLVRCGSFDSIHEQRAGVAASLDSALEGGASAQRDRELGQESLFGSSLDSSPGSSELPEVPPWSESERLSGEKEVLGFYVSGHPLEDVIDKLSKVTNVRSGTAEERTGRDARVGGLLTNLRETRTRRGAIMAFGTLEDLDGTFELVIFAEPYKQLKTLLKGAVELSEGRVMPLVLEGSLELGDPPKLLVRDGWELDKAEEFLAKALRIRLPVADVSEDRLLALNAVFDQHRGDCSVHVHVVIPGESETVLALPDSKGVNASIELCRAVDGLFGRPVSELSR